MKMPAALQTILDTWGREFPEVGRAVKQILRDLVVGYIPSVHVVQDVGEAAAMDIEDLPFEDPLFVYVINETTGEAFSHMKGMTAATSFKHAAAANTYEAANGITLTTGPASKVTLGTDVQADADVINVFVLGV